MIINVLLIVLCVIQLCILLNIIFLRRDTQNNNQRVLSPTRPIMNPEVFDAIRNRKLI
jgi:hypothetical protein